MFFFINAAGRLVLSFPRIKLKDIMLSNRKPGALGFAQTTGWITEDCFVKALEHFVIHSRPLKENPALILMDNQSTYVNLIVVEFARQNIIILVTFPPSLHL